MALRVKRLVTYWRSSRTGVESVVRESVVHLVDPTSFAPVCRNYKGFHYSRNWPGRQPQTRIRDVWESPPPPGNLTCQNCQRWLKRR